ncbi:hypothetical protein EOM81_13290, partial [bacterium]|nr:hypothetical protein [bacterium]
MALSNVFTDYAILQAEQKVNIWGNYHQKPQVKIIHEKSGREFLPLSLHAENGLFTAEFPPFLPYYDAYSLQYFENGELLQQVNHLLFGDVYLAIGQSNMAMCVAASGQSEEIQSLKKDGNLRCLLFQDRFDEKGNILLSDKPLTELLSPGWMVLDNEKAVSA